MGQQTLMSRWSWSDPYGPGRGTYWTDGWDGYPHARIDERGFVAFEIDEQALMAQLFVVDNIEEPASAVRVGARYAVDPRRPGVQAV